MATKRLVDNFLTAIAGICKQYGLSLSHEDDQGAFLVEIYKESNIKWLMGADNKTSEKKIEPLADFLVRRWPNVFYKAFSEVALSQIGRIEGAVRSGMPKHVTIHLPRGLGTTSIVKYASRWPPLKRAGITLHE